MNHKKHKTCPECKKMLPVDMFVDLTCNKNPRGRYCIDCRQKKDFESREIHFDGLLYAEIEYMKKYQILYEENWKSKATPNNFFLILFMERNSCPYCGISFEKDQKSKDYFMVRKKYQIDHMNPLSIGGEDSLLNAICVCKKCNLRKNKQDFDTWLKSLSSRQQTIATKIYIQKLGYSPGEFVPSEPTIRSSGLRYELSLSVDVLLQMKKENKLYL